MKKNCYCNCCPGSSNKPVPQIEPQPKSSCQYPLMNYLDLTAESAKDYFIESLEESRVELGQNLTRLSDVITNRVCEKSSVYLKQVSDIPR